jgi:RNA polymerase sigma factor (sigma-70 family)
MTNPSPEGLRLTPDLLEYAKAVALTEARKRCSQRVGYRDAVQEATLNLLKSAPHYDPAKGASAKTYIYTVVQWAVIKYAAREVRHAQWFKQFDRPLEAPVKAGKAASGHTFAPGQITDERKRELAWTLDDILRYVDNEESRALCRLVVECKGSIRAAAKRLGVVEGTVRYRLGLLKPRLLAAGFNPFEEETRHDGNRSRGRAARRRGSNHRGRG